MFRATNKMRKKRIATTVCQVVTTSKQDHNWLSKPLCDLSITSASVSNKSAVSWACEFPALPRSSQANKIMTSIFIHYPPHWYFSCLYETIFPVHFFLCGVYALRQSAFICKGQLLEFLKCKFLKLHHSYYWMFMEAVVDTKMGIFSYLRSNSSSNVPSLLL